MEPEIVYKSEMNITGLILHTSFKDDRSKREIPPFFHKVLEEKRLDSVPMRINGNQLCVFSIKRNNPDFDYLMGVEVCGKDISNGLEHVTLPASKYATLKIVKRGPEDVGKAFEHIFKKWIPKSVYIPTGAPAFIYYDQDFFSVFNEKGYSGNPQATVYVPVKLLAIKQILKFLKII
jgi:predicted transcriptional regulator YdeE